MVKKLKLINATFQVFYLLVLLS